MKKEMSLIWDVECQKSFNDIKQYLTNPSLLTTPMSGNPFLLCVRVMDHDLGALLAQTNENGHDKQYTTLAEQ